MCSVDAARQVWEKADADSEQIFLNCNTRVCWCQHPNVRLESLKFFEMESFEVRLSPSTWRTRCLQVAFALALAGFKWHLRWACTALPGSCRLV